MGILLEVAVISLFMSLLLVVLSKFLTNQKELKRIKQEVQDYESKIKEAKKAGDQKAVADYSSKKLKVAMGQFKESRKSMMVSMVVHPLSALGVPIIFPWPQISRACPPPGFFL